MLAEIITIGDELLIGQVVDTNSAFIAKALNAMGVSIYQITSVQDDATHILQAFADAEQRASIIIITGGLGPTKDDVTKKTIATYFKDTLVRDAAVLQNIETIWKRHGRGDLLQVNKDQALVPSKAKVLMNTIGTAPGMLLEKGETTFIALPGVPFEMKKLINEAVIPELKAKYDCPYILHKTLLTAGIGESTLAQRIEAWELALPKTIKLAYLPNLGSVRLRLSSQGFNANQVEAGIAAQIQAVLPLIEDVFIGFEDEVQSIEALIAQRLTDRHKTLAVAESCTGGALAAKFTQNPGASAYFKGGVVSYATASKTTVLEVPEALVATHSVVSAPVVEAMAKNACNLFGADYGVATTGNAGPSKGDSNEDLGTVYVAVASKLRVISEKFTLGTERKRVIERAVNKALQLLEKEILKN